MDSSKKKEWTLLVILLIVDKSHRVQAKKCRFWVLEILKPFEEHVVFQNLVNGLQLGEGVCETIWNPAFCLFLYLTDIHFRGKYSIVVTSVSQKSSVEQPGLEK